MTINNIFNKKTITTAIVLKVAISVVVLIFFNGFVNADSDATYGISKNITQAKTADSPIVYYLDHKRGLKKAYVNEASFLAYGNKWSDIKIVSRKELDKWAEMRLVKTAVDPKIYYISDGKKAWVETEGQFVSSGFKWADVATIARTDLDSYKNISFDKLSIASLAPGGTGETTVNSKDVLLQVSLDSSNPASTFIPSASRGNTVAVFKFRATGGEAKINKLTLTRHGVTSDNAIESVYLTDEAGNMLGYKVGLAAREAYINFGSDPIIIPANSAKIILVKADVKPVTDVVGQTLGFGILSLANIDSAVSISAVFPLKGAEHKLIDGTNNLGKLKVSSIVLNNEIKTSNIGAGEEKISSFRFKETSDKEDIEIRKMILTNIGSAYDSDIKNIRLLDPSGRLIIKAERPVGKKVIFDIPGGYLIKKGRSSDLAVKIDIAGGDGRGVKFVIKGSDDIAVRGRETGYGLFASSDENFPVGQSCGNNCNRIVIKRAPLFLSAVNLNKDDLKIYRDQNGALLGLFELRNGPADIRIESMNFSVVTSGGAPALDSPVYLSLYKKGNKVEYEEISSVNSEGINNKTGEINIRYAVAGRKDFKFVFLTNIPETVESGAGYQIKIKDISYYIGEDNRLYMDILDKSGQAVKVVKPAVYLFADKFSDKDLAVAGDTKVKLGVFKIEATSDEKVTVTEIIVANAAGATPAVYTNGFSNLALYKGGSKISDIIAQPNANSYTFSNLKLNIDTSSSADLNVRADLADNTDGETRLILENITAQGYKSKAPVVIYNKGAASMSAKITRTKLAIKADSGGEAVTGKKDNKIAVFTFTNKAAEAVKLNKVSMVSDRASGGISAVNGFTNLRFGTEAKGKIKQVGSKINSPSAESVQISLGGQKLTVGESLTLNLYVDAAANVAPSPIDLYLKGVEVKGYISEVEATIEGDPTDKVIVAVEAAGGSFASSGSAVAAAAGGGLSWPTDSKKINYYFHDSKHPYNSVAEHEGIDIDVSQGTAVKAAADGEIIAAATGASGYNYVIIQHANNLKTVYGHLSRIDVNEGDKVKKGQLIGLSGGRPGTAGAGQYSNGPHLHFEVWYNNEAVDPMRYLE